MSRQPAAGATSATSTTSRGALLSLKTVLEEGLTHAEQGVLKHRGSLTAIAAATEEFSRLPASMKGQPVVPEAEVGHELRVGVFHLLLRTARAWATDDAALNLRAASVLQAALTVGSMGPRWLTEGLETKALVSGDFEWHLLRCTLPGINAIDEDTEDMLDAAFCCCRAVQQQVQRSKAAAGQHWHGSEEARRCGASQMVAARAMAVLDCWLKQDEYGMEGPRAHAASGRRYALISAAFEDAMTGSIATILQPSSSSAAQALAAVRLTHAEQLAVLLNEVIGSDDCFPSDHPRTLHAQLECCTRLLETVAGGCSAGSVSAAVIKALRAILSTLLITLGNRPRPTEAALERCYGVCKSFAEGRFALPDDLAQDFKNARRELAMTITEVRVMGSIGMGTSFSLFPTPKPPDPEELLAILEAAEAKSAKRARKRARARKKKAAAAAQGPAEEGAAQQASSSASAPPQALTDSDQEEQAADRQPGSSSQQTVPAARELDSCSPVPETCLAGGEDEAAPQLSTMQRRRLRQQRRRERNARRTAAGGQQEELAAQLGALAVGQQPPAAS